MLAFDYAPKPDGRPDPGEVVWTWVPYEDDPRQGKDRPVLIVARSLVDGRLYGLYLTSKDHDRDARQEASVGRFWRDIGVGGWDPRRRPSEVRLDRLIVIDPAAVRREGAAVSRSVFDRVVAAARPYIDPGTDAAAGSGAGASTRSSTGRIAGLVRRLRGR